MFFSNQAFFETNAVPYARILAIAWDALVAAFGVERNGLRLSEACLEATSVGAQFCCPMFQFCQYLRCDALPAQRGQREHSFHLHHLLFQWLDGPATDGAIVLIGYNDVFETVNSVELRIKGVFVAIANSQFGIELPDERDEIRVVGVGAF